MALRLGSAIRDEDESERLVRGKLEERLIDDEVASPLELESVSLLHEPQVGVPEGIGDLGDDRVDELLEVLVLIELLLGDEVVKLHQLDRHKVLHVRQPRQLLLSLLVVALQMQVGIHAGHSAVRQMDLADDGIAPIHQRHLLALLHHLGVLLLYENGLGVGDDLLSQCRVFLVLSYCLVLHCLWSVAQMHGHSG